MTVFIALLRGINVGGNKKIKTADLKTVYETQGLRNVQTLLQSGNVVFEADAADSETLARQLEAVLQASHGFHSELFLRTVHEWRAIVDGAPYTPEQLAEPSKLLVLILSAAPTDTAFAELLAAHHGTEVVMLSERALYVYYPDGMGRSKFDHPLIERKLKISATGRNWNTVTKLLALAQSQETP